METGRGDTLDWPDVYSLKLIWFGNILTDVLSILNFSPHTLSAFNQTKATQLFDAEAIRCSCGKLILCGKNRGQRNLIQRHKYMTQQYAWEAHGQIKQM